MPESRDAFEIFQPVYEKNDQAVLGQYLVMTPWMLLDRLKECRELSRALRQCVRLGRDGGIRAECPVRVMRQLETLNAEIEQSLFLLWRGGLWAESVEARTAADGRAYRVVREPFTDGKPFGKPLPADASPWQVELLGVEEF